MIIGWPPTSAPSLALDTLEMTSGAATSMTQTSRN